MTDQSHPYQYQLTHWWHWLAYGQNAAVVQALAAITATIAAISAALFAARAYRATLAQVTIANAQIRLMKEQFRDERSRYAQERQSAAQAALLEFKQRRSREEAARPRFADQGGYRQSPGLQSINFKNIGSSAALEVSATSVRTSQQLTYKSHVPPDSVISVPTDYDEVSKEGIQFAFRTEFGSKWTTRVTFHGEVGQPEVESDYQPHS